MRNQINRIRWWLSIKMVKITSLMADSLVSSVGILSTIPQSHVHTSSLSLPQSGNFTWFANHPCLPEHQNAKFQQIGNIVFMITTKPIKAKSEIFVYYSKLFEIQYSMPIYIEQYANNNLTDEQFLSICCRLSIPQDRCEAVVQQVKNIRAKYTHS
jgi:hypothetical protein